MLAEAGIPITGYQEARDVLNAAADLVDMNKSHFDHSIWQHMSRRQLSYAPKDAPAAGEESRKSSESDPSAFTAPKRGRVAGAGMNKTKIPPYELRPSALAAKQIGKTAAAFYDVASLAHLR